MSYLDRVDVNEKYPDEIWNVPYTWDEDKDNNISGIELYLT